MLGKAVENGVPGQAQVVGCTPPPYPMGRYVSGVKLNLIVHAQDREPYKLVHECTVPGAKHPRPGMSLGVLVDPDDPEKISIDWDAIPSPDEQFARMPLPAPAAVPTQAAPAPGDPVERLEKLARLREAGVLSEAEFDALKAQILADS